jgi:hypothetical protein
MRALSRSGIKLPIVLRMVHAVRAGAHVESSQLPRRNFGYFTGAYPTILVGHDAGLFDVGVFTSGNGIGDFALQEVRGVGALLN